MYIKTVLAFGECGFKMHWMLTTMGMNKQNDYAILNVENRGDYSGAAESCVSHFIYLSSLNLCSFPYFIQF